MKTMAPFKSPATTLAPVAPSDKKNPVSTDELASLDFLRGLPREQIESIVPFTMHSEFEPDEQIFCENDLADRFYILLSGKVAIECKVDRAKVTVQELGAGDAIGFSWMFSPERLHFTARVIEPVRAIFFYGTLLRANCDLHPELGYEIMQRAGHLMLLRMEALVALLIRERKAGCTSQGACNQGEARSEEG
jgi:CRP/FNR family transcriptional regulator, cyclic AMP receptor protein